MRKIKSNTIKTLHTGNLLKAKMDEQRISKAELARRMNRSQSTITAYLKRSSMQVYLLWELSLALNYNFIQHLADQLISEAGKTNLVNGNAPDKLKIETLEKELAQMREERDYLKKMIDILAKK